MDLNQSHFDKLDSHWAVSVFTEQQRQEVLSLADQRMVDLALAEIMEPEGKRGFDSDEVDRLATAYELAAFEGIEAVLYPSNQVDSKELRYLASAGAHRAFGLRRVLELGADSIEMKMLNVLHLAGLAYCGDRWTDLKRWLSDNDIGAIDTYSYSSWDTQLLYSIFSAWVRLLRKDSWQDLNDIAPLIQELREKQKVYEGKYLNSASNSSSGDGRRLAFRLVALYHWARATECIAEYMLQGSPSSVVTILNQHFEPAVKAASASQDSRFEMILRWLHVASRKMVANSVWSIAQTVSSRVYDFIESATKNKAMFELLPPQRVALKDLGLLDPASRAVVVDMPTSGGKTALAQFKILQALNQFSNDYGWVVYVAPTRALVSQITRRLRSDFEPLGIKVEQLTGAIEVDSFEEDLLNSEDSFQVLVTTPEKLQLVIRNKKIKRPLALTVLDEAHNIEDESRGLRIELLLATIKQECPKSNFLLLMPFVPNSGDLAQWLGDDTGKNISLSTSTWQPNERIVGLFRRKPEEGKGNWSLEYESLVTPQRSICLRGTHKVGPIRPINKLSYSAAKSLSTQAAAMASVFSKRGTSVAVFQKIPDAWSAARKLSKEMPLLPSISSEIALVQRFLATEIDENFELIELLSKGIGLHHAGLPSEALALIEWLTEIGEIKVLCATTTIAQGLNFPVSSVFLASYKYPMGAEMSHRAFWNLAGRAGRVQHDSVGVVGVAAGEDEVEIKKFISSATSSLISRMEEMLSALDSAGDLNNLSVVLNSDQWSDFRSYIAHLWNEKRNLDVVISETENLLRNTYGFSSLRGRTDDKSKNQAEAILGATKTYVRELAKHPINASLADATGFSPEGARTALLELDKLENKIQPSDWKSESLFGKDGSSLLPDLIGVMMKVPQIKSGLEEFSSNGSTSTHIADISRDWVAGSSIRDIAKKYFAGRDDAVQLSKACRAVFRDLANNGAWGLSALSKMPTSGLDFEKLSDDEKRHINNLPAMMYHGVRSEEAVLMRMNSVPRSVAESLGETYKRENGELRSGKATEFLKELSESDWDQVRPDGASMSGLDYKKVWMKLSGTS